MTVSSTQTVKIYQGDDTSTRFVVPFLFLADNDLQVELEASDGVRRTVLPRTIAGAGSDSGYVVLNTAPARDERVVIYRVSPQTQDTGLSTGSTLAPAVVEASIDRAALRDQELDTRVKAAVAIPLGGTANTILPTATARANKILGFDNAGNVAVSQVNLGRLEAFVTSGFPNMLQTDDISGGFDGNQTTFALRIGGRPVEDVIDITARVPLAFLNGIQQQAGTAVSYAGGNITFASPPNAGERATVLVLGLSSTSTTTGSRDSGSGNSAAPVNPVSRTAPQSPQNGMVWFELGADNLLHSVNIWWNGQWQRHPVAGTVTGTPTVGGSGERPAVPVDQAVHFNTEASRIEVWNSQLRQWVAVGWGISGNLAGIGVVARVADLPGSANTGDLQFVSGTGQLFIWSNNSQGGQWVNDFATARLGANSITGSMIAANTIVTNHIATAAVTGDRIAGETITASHLAADLITARHIRSGAVTGNHIAANTIAGANIQANTLSGQHLAAGTINADRLIANSIQLDTTQLRPNAVTTYQFRQSSRVQVQAVAPSYQSIHRLNFSCTAGGFRHITVSGFYSDERASGVPNTDGIAFSGQLRLLLNRQLVNLSDISIYNVGTWSIGFSYLDTVSRSGNLTIELQAAISTAKSYGAGLRSPYLGIVEFKR